MERIPPYHLWCSFYGICAGEKGARSRIPSNGEWRRQTPLVHQRRKVEARTQEGTTRDWSRVYGPSSKGILCLSWKFSPTPPRNSLDLKELAKGLANPTQGWERSGCENRFVFPFSNSGCFCRDFHKDGVTKVLSKRAHKPTKFLRAV